MNKTYGKFMEKKATVNDNLAPLRAKRVRGLIFQKGFDVEN